MKSPSRMDHTEKLENLQKRIEIEEKKREMQNKAFSDASLSVLEFQDFAITARKIFDACKDLIGAQSGYVALLTPDGSENEVLFLEAGGLPCAVDPELPMPIRGLREVAYREKRAVYHNDFSSSKWKGFLPSGHVELKNVLFAPLIVENQAKGLLGLANKRRNFTDEDAEIAESFGQIASVALLNSENLGKIKESEEKIREALQNTNFYKDLLLHDISNVLQALSGLSKIATMRMENILEPDNPIRDNINKISEQVKRGVKLVKNIRKIAELEEDSIKPVKGVLSEILNRSIINADTYFPNEDLVIEMEEKEENVAVLINEFVEDVFDNLFINAVLHNTNEKKFISVTIDTINLNEGKYGYVSVQDNGIGVPDSMKEKIFWREGEKLKNTRGMGIGLSLVTKILKGLDGKIWVEDAVEGDHSKGSKFVVLLPIVD